MLGYAHRQESRSGVTRAGRCEFGTSDQMCRTPGRDESPTPRFALVLVGSAGVVLNPEHRTLTESGSKLLGPNVFVPVCQCQSVLFSVSCFIELERMNPKPLSFPEPVRFAAVLSLALSDGTDSGEWIFN